MRLLLLVAWLAHCAAENRVDRVNLALEMVRGSSLRSAGAPLQPALATPPTHWLVKVAFDGQERRLVADTGSTDLAIPVMQDMLGSISTANVSFVDCTGNPPYWCANGKGANSWCEYEFGVVGVSGGDSGCIAVHRQCSNAEGEQISLDTCSADTGCQVCALYGLAGSYHGFSGSVGLADVSLFGLTRPCTSFIGIKTIFGADHGGLGVADGIMGLSHRAASTYGANSFVFELTQSAALPSAFALRLGASQGDPCLSIGGADPAMLQSPLQYIGVMDAGRQTCRTEKKTASMGWYVGLSRVELGDESSFDTPMSCGAIPSQASPVLFDSGTPAFWVAATNVFDALTDSLSQSSNCEYLSEYGAIVCYDPVPITFHFAADPNAGYMGSETVAVTVTSTQDAWEQVGENWRLRVEKSGQSILGSSFLRQYLFEFDLDLNRVGFTNSTMASCASSTFPSTPHHIATNDTMCQVKFPSKSSSGSHWKTWYYIVIAIGVVVAIALTLAFLRTRRATNRGVPMQQLNVHLLAPSQPPPAYQPPRL